MTDPVKKGRLYMRRCPVCERWAPYESCYGDSEVGEHPPVTTERIEVRPAQEVERLEQVLRELVEAAEAVKRGWDYNVKEGIGDLLWDACRDLPAALSQAREILGGSDESR